MCNARFEAAGVLEDPRAKLERRGPRGTLRKGAERGAKANIYIEKAGEPFRALPLHGVVRANQGAGLRRGEGIPKGRGSAARPYWSVRRRQATPLLGILFPDHSPTSLSLSPLSVRVTGKIVCWCAVAVAGIFCIPFALGRGGGGICSDGNKSA